MTGQGPSAGDRLRPFVPRQVLHWLAESPAATYREIDGTLVFVDISGFTKLSERLAKRGKVGAEELTDAIGSCFTQLLGVSYGQGGGLLKFGGDALLLFFQGVNHTMRGAQAAVGMRRALHDMGAIDCSGTKVSLRMSVGVHTGTFQFFLVGDSHRELLVTGPGASETVRMESTADAGEIVVSEATAALLPAAVLGPAKGTGRLLRRQPPGLTTWTPEPDLAAAGLPIDTCIPATICRQALSGDSEPEHKLVTVGFLHFDGTDELIEQYGAAAAADALKALVTDVQAAANRHEICFLASDVDSDGGKVILTAGAPTATGDDEERMLRALRDVIATPRAIGVRAGVNTGHVFAGEIGPPYRRTYTVMGDAVNLAARIMAKATSGELLAADAVLARSRAPFATDALEPFLVKGKSKPVHAFRVGEPLLSVQPQLAVGLMLGRDRDLELLTGALNDARAGRGRFIELVGEAGIGKSRLLTELRAGATGVLELTTTCQPYESSTPYYAYRELLRAALAIPIDADQASAGDRLLGALAEHAPDLRPWAPLIAIAVDGTVASTPEVDRLDEKFRGARLRDVVAELLGRVLTTPTVVVFEDAHSMDEASVSLTQQLATGLAERPWLLLAARRDAGAALADPGNPQATTLRLEPIALADAARLAEALVDETAGATPLPPHDVAALAERSGGNPLYVRQLVRALLAAGSLHDVPDSLEGVVAARIDALPPAERSILRRLAVLGNRFERVLAETVLDVRLPTGRRSSGLDEFLAVDAREVRFRQALVRDAAYESLPFRVRERLHGDVADAIQARAGSHSDDIAAALSTHYFYARRYDAALRYSQIAAAHARSIYANVDAAGFYQRALDAARRCDGVPDAVLCSLYESLGDVRKRMGEYAGAAEAYRLARRLVADEAFGTARLLLKEGGVRKQQGRYPLARRWLRRVTQTVHGLDSPVAAKLRAQVAVAYAAVAMEECRYGELVKSCLRAIDVARAAGDSDALAHALQLLDVGYGELGRWNDATHFPEALALYEQLGDLWGQGTVLNNMGAHAYFHGRWDEAAQLYERARAAWETVGDAVYAALATANEAEILSDQGRLVEADDLFKKALRVARAAGDRWGVGYAHRNLGVIAARARRFDDADHHLAQARAEFAAIGADTELYETEVRGAECLVLAGQGTAALAAAARLLGSTVDAGNCDALLHRVAGQASAQLGEYGEAEQSLRQALTAAEAHGNRYETGLTLLALARLAALADVGETADALRAQSEALFAQLDVRWVAEPVISLLDHADLPSADAVEIPGPREPAAAPSP
jgi:class 3 adenylate cyclase/tetratricopeptide (TPR) repeat protein